MSEKEQYLDTLQSFLSLYSYLRKESRRIQESGFSGRQIAVMRLLAQEGPSTVGRLRRYLFINYSSTSELLCKMEKTGVVSRTRSAEDNRKVVITLTEKGMTTLEATEIRGIPLLRERLKALQTDRLEDLKHTFDFMNELLGVEVSVDG